MLEKKSTYVSKFNINLNDSISSDNHFIAFNIFLQLYILLIIIITFIDTISQIVFIFTNIFSKIKSIKIQTRIIP